MKPNLKKRVAQLFIIIAFILGVWLFLVVSKPRVTLTVNGIHNPLENKVAVDGKNLYPSGKGGVNYKTSVWYGNHTVTLKGPFIETEQQEISLSFFANTSLRIDIKPKSAETIAKEILNDPSAKIQGLRVFGDSIIFSAINTKVLNEEGESSHPVALVYDDEQGSWKNLSAIELSNVKDVDISEAGIEYFYGLDNE